MIFLDYQSTTPVDDRVMDAMLPYFTQKFGNPHSTEHSFGMQAQHAIDEGAARVSAVIGAAASDVIFTSGATEANNLALRGLIPERKKVHFISCVAEHKSVLGILSALEREGHAVTLLPIDAEGRVDPEVAKAAIRPSTVLMSIMAVNSEIGVIQPLEELGRLCRSHDILFHTDAAQAYGKIDIDVVCDHVDLMSFSAHKIYGPKGIGALYARESARKRLRPLVIGGGQQGGLRGGTIPVPLVVGFGIAAALMQEEAAIERAQLANLRDRLWAGLQDAVGGIHLNGSREHRIEGNLNVRIDHVDADSLLLAMPDVAISTGSACSSGALTPSSVLLALGLSPEQASQSVRFGLGRMTSEADIDAAVERLAQVVAELRD